jgi:hypothetical protein
MADQQQQHAPGGHYSASNRVPNVQQFIAGLDKDKKERDRQIDQQNAGSQGDIKPHTPLQAGVKGTQKTVTDPTTGRQVVIEDVNKKMMSNVDNPIVSLMPHAPHLR